MPMSEGPWNSTYAAVDGWWTIRDGRGIVMGEIFEEGDARAIAALPELISAGQSLIHYIRSNIADEDEISRSLIDDIVSAIPKLDGPERSV